MKQHEVLPYCEGTVFAVPLRTEGYAIGVVARATHIGKIILVYLFGPTIPFLPSSKQVPNPEPTKAIRVLRIGDLGLIDGSWDIVGIIPKWQRNAWPFPQFIRRDEIGKKAWVVTYSDDDPNQVVSEDKVAFDTKGYERNSVLGSGAVELLVTKLLS